MRINHNIASLNTYRQLSNNSAATNKNIEKLSSGLRINRAGDDAAGLAISEKMRGQIRGLDQAARNSQDGISLIQTAEGALSETHSILQRMRELAGQAANGTLTTDDREKIQGEVNQLVDEIDKIGNQTEFNTKKLLNGSIGTTATSNNTYSDASQKTAVIVRNTTSETTAGGAYTLTTAGTQTATAAGTFAGGFTNDSITITNTASGEAWTIALQDNDDATAVIGRFNEMTDDTGVEAFIGANGSVMLRSEDYGTNSAFTVTGTGTALTKAGIGAVTNGVNAVIGGALAADGYTADGNTITMTGGNSEGLQFEIAGTNDTATITGLNVTAGAVNGDTIVINGVSKALIAGDLDNNTELVSVINSMTRDTGVTAAIDGATVKLTSVGSGDGQTISAAFTGTLAFGAGVVTAGTDNIANASANNAATITVSASDVDFHVGSNKDQTMSLSINDMRAKSLGTGLTATDLTNVASFTNGVEDFKTNSTFSTVSLAEDSIKVLDEAISKVSGARANLGAVQNRLEHTINNLNTSSENLTAAESRIRDTDMAKEMMEQTKNNILAQAAQAMLAQANQQPQGVLQLLR